MRDTYGDKIEVLSFLRHEHIYLTFFDSEHDSLCMSLTARKARKLARKLNQHASLVEISQG